MSKIREDIMSIIKNNYTSIIKTSLCINSNKGPCSSEEISKMLSVNCTESRKKEDFPKCSIDAGVAHNEWIYEIVYEETDKTGLIQYEIDKLEMIFGGKIKEIKEICQKYDAEVLVNVYVYENELDDVFLGLTRNNLRFLNEINAEIALVINNI